MLEAGIGRAHNIALSTLSNFKLPGDVSASKRYWKEDIIEPEVEVSSAGMMAVSDRAWNRLSRSRGSGPENYSAGRDAARSIADVQMNRVNVGRLLLKSRPDDWHAPVCPARS